MSYLLIAIGGALGSVGRYWCSTLLVARFGTQFPWLATVVVNVIGSFLIGAAFGVIEPGPRWAVAQSTRDAINQFFMVGVLGGYTTFSAFSLQTLNLLRERQWGHAGANVCLSVALCLVAVWLGFALATSANRSL